MRTKNIKSGRYEIREPAVLTEHVVGILYRLARTSKSNRDSCSYLIELIIKAVLIQGLDREPPPGHSCERRPT